MGWGWSGRTVSLWQQAAALAMVCIGSAVAPASGSPMVAGDDPAAVVAEYRVNPGDELEVSVWGEDRMQKTVRVLPDGTFAFPLAGRVDAGGSTPREIAQTIKTRISGSFRAAVPEVTVTVRDPAGMRFYVVGKVRAPGMFPIDRSINVLQALSMAGGAADFADVSHAVLLRQTQAGQVTVPVNLARILKAGRVGTPGKQATALPTLGAGDVLVVP